MNDSPGIEIQAAGAWPAFEVANPSGRRQAVITCDHASPAIPPELDDLGLGPAELARHIAWDVGAAEVARGLAALLDVAAVLCGTSRLVVDCNRMADDPTAMPMVSDGIAVPGNVDLDAPERERRRRLYFRPYHDEVARRLARAGPEALVISVHSFTPVMDGVERPWHVGVVNRCRVAQVADLVADPLAHIAVVLLSRDRVLGSRQRGSNALIALKHFKRLANFIS